MGEQAMSLTSAYTNTTACCLSELELLASLARLLCRIHEYRCRHYV